MPVIKCQLMVVVQLVHAMQDQDRQTEGGSKLVDKMMDKMVDKLVDKLMDKMIGVKMRLGSDGKEVLVRV